MNQQGQWQVAGSAPEAYERELVPAVFGVWAPIVVELAHPRPGERALDVACGIGWRQLWVRRRKAHPEQMFSGLPQ